MNLLRTFTLIVLLPAATSKIKRGTTPLHTNWDAISETFETKWASTLPPVPETNLEVSTDGLFLNPETGPFQKLTLSTRTSDGWMCGNTTTYGQWVSAHDLNLYVVLFVPTIYYIYIWPHATCHNTVKVSTRC